mmetsp:Transcript_11971/g.33145  ORF Transcript_11971/g.33145 Transcript_11971/m.33145 type:complete len:81 (+) Transcript_11971:178-420(+)
MALKMEDMDDLFAALDNRRNLLNLQEDGEDGIIWLLPEGMDHALNQSLEELVVGQEVVKQRELVLDDDLSPECLKLKGWD